MNTYTITARAMYDLTYEVEAATEDEAIRMVEYGDVDPDRTDWTGEVEDVEVTDVQYGEREYVGKLGVTFLVTGDIEEGSVIDALYSLLMKCDGTTLEYKDAQLELIGFSVDHVEEA